MGGQDQRKGWFRCRSPQNFEQEHDFLMQYPVHTTMCDTEHTIINTTSIVYSVFKEPLSVRPHLKDYPFDLKSVRTLGRTFYS